MVPQRLFTVGQDVHIALLTYKPGTKIALDPVAITVLSFTRNGTAVYLFPSFTRTATGQNEMLIATGDLDPGTYKITVQVSNGTSAVQASDAFVLQAA